MHSSAANNIRRRALAAFTALLCAVLIFLSPAPAADAAQGSALRDWYGIQVLSFDTDQILSIGNQASGQCSLYALRYARTILDGQTCSGRGMWSNGVIWSAGGYTDFSGTLSQCLGKIYSELAAGRPVIVHLQNTTVSGAAKHPNRITTNEYHLTDSGWSIVNYPHISTSSTYGHWVCVVGFDPAADPANLEESDFFALDPARISANGTLALTRLLDGTVWVNGTSTPLKISA